MNAAQTSSALPVEAALPELIAALRAHRRAVLVAPPGAGKTTRVPPALLASGVAGDGEIVLLQPRRVAARTLARRLAAQVGEPVGRTVGYQVRFERKVSAHTRIRVVTEGILTARLQADPELTGVSVVILDEFHERSLHADLALALLKEVQEALRADLHLVVMSATLDAEAVAEYLARGGRPCPVVRAPGRAHPLTVSYASAPDERPAGARVAAGVLQLLDARPASTGVLAFLPGVREIDDARSRLLDPLRGRGWAVEVLHGRMRPEDQDRALTPGPRPRVILATNVAETSLTVDGIDAVVDSGLVRRLRLDVAVGQDRLETELVSQASADQRAGRAGRLGPGQVLRLWTEHDQRGLRPFDEPEIRRVELTRAALEIRAWGVPDVAEFDFFEAPPAQTLAAADQLLRDLGAVRDGRLTATGAALRQLPAHPRSARVFVEAARAGWVGEGALLAALLEEPRALRGPPSLQVTGSDLLVRRRQLASSRDPAAQRLQRAAKQLTSAWRRAGESCDVSPTPPSEGQLERLILAGYPDRVCLKRSETGDELVMVGGRGARLGRDSSVRGDRLLVALDVDAGRRGRGATSLVRAASRVDEAWLVSDEVDTLSWEPAGERVTAHRERRYRDLVLGSAQVRVRERDRERAASVLCEAALRDPVRALKPSPGDQQLVARIVTLARAVPELSVEGGSLEPASLDGAAIWEAAVRRLCVGRSSFAEVRKADLGAAIRADLSWQVEQALREDAPTHVAIPSGRSARLAYALDGGPPVLAVKVQELYGATLGPSVARGRVSVLLHLLDPAGRPLQVTSDLASFWAGAWSDARKQMRSRYPKHRWPESPGSAEPSVSSLRKKRR